MVPVQTLEYLVRIGTKPVWALWSHPEIQAQEVLKALTCSLSYLCQGDSSTQTETTKPWAATDVGPRATWEVSNVRGTRWKLLLLRCQSQMVWGACASSGPGTAARGGGQGSKPAAVSSMGCCPVRHEAEADCQRTREGAGAVVTEKPAALSAWAAESPRAGRLKRTLRGNA